MSPQLDFADRVSSYSRRARQLEKLSAGRRRMRRGAAYASAAGAALAGASAAEAGIVYSGIQNATAQIPGVGAIEQDIESLSSAAPVPLTLEMSVVRGFTFIGIPAYQGAGLEGFSGLSFAGTDPLAINFPAGSPITGPFSTSEAFVATTLYVGGLEGNFADGVPGFVGFLTGAGNKGWIQVQWDDNTGDGLPDRLTAIDWAYNDMGGPINAGQTMLTIVPEAGAAALVALIATGAVGVAALKKRKKG
jgi:hypothetical protein